MPLRLLGIVLTLAVFMLPTVSACQSKRTRPSGFGSSYRKIRKEAEKIGAHLPDLFGGEQTFVILVGGHARNFDVIFFTGPEISQEVLFTECKKFAIDSGYPKADFIVREHEKSRFVDIELNDYIEYGGDWKKETQSISFDLGKFVGAIKKSELAKYDWQIVVDATNVDRHESSGIPGQVALGSVVVLRPNRVETNATIREFVTVTWAHKLAGWSFFVFLVGMFCFIPISSIRHALKKPKPREPLEIDPEINDPVARQVAYNAFRMPRGFWILILLLPSFLLLAPNIDTGFMNRALDVSPLPMVMNQFGPLSMIMFILGIGALSLGIPMVVEWVRKRRGEEIPKDQNPMLSNRTIGVLMLAMICIVTFGFLFASVPAFRQLPRETRLAILMAPPILLIVAMPFLFRREQLGKQRKLQPGDFWFDRAMEIANKARTRVSRVVVTDLDAANAFATPFGTVGMTQKLLDELSEQEATAIVAHEVGHQKLFHTKKRLAWVVVELLILIGLSMYLRSVVPRDAPVFGILIYSPILFLLVPPLLGLAFVNRRSQENEFAADRFAVEMVGDPDVMIDALYKVTESNHGVHELKDTEQRWMSHPSLRKRVLRIMEDFPGSGKHVTVHESGAIIISKKEPDTADSSVPLP